MQSIACQARHAVLVCQTVKEMDELRFVLVPKRLTDERFWDIYFAVTRSRLPAEAFDLALQQKLAPAAECPRQVRDEPPQWGNTSSPWGVPPVTGGTRSKVT